MKRNARQKPGAQQQGNTLKLTAAQHQALIEYELAISAETVVFENYQKATPQGRERLAPQIGLAIDRADKAQDNLDRVFDGGVFY